MSARPAKLTRDTSWKHEATGLAWISPWVIGFLAFTAGPIVMSLYYSVTDYSLLEKPVFIGAENYQRLARDEIFLGALKNTLWYAAVSIPLSTIFAIILAAMLNTRIKARALFRAAMFIPTLVPIVASAMVWSWLLNGQIGLLNQALGWIGIKGPDWLGDRHVAMWALILMSVWGAGNAVVIYLAALQDVPTSLYEAADLDGVTWVGKFWHVTLPMISPVILFNVITSIIGTLQVFAVPYIMTGGGPDRSTYFFTMYLYDNAFRYLNMGYASAMAWIQLVIILALTALTFWLSRKLVFYRSA
jgi:multiple sugar transport system permease protein